MGIVNIPATHLTDLRGVRGDNRWKDFQGEVASKIERKEISL